jgi:hypothetical protein
MFEVDEPDEITSTQGNLLQKNQWAQMGTRNFPILVE